MKKALSLFLKIFSFILFINSFLVLNPFNVSAEIISGDYIYTVTNSKAVINQYTGNASNLTIPDTLDGFTVTEIGDFAFFQCTSLTELTIGNNVTAIGSTAFCDCTSLTKVVIGNNVTAIGTAAFANCNLLTNVVIGNSVTSIGESVFFHCSSLTSVTFGNKVTEIGYAAFMYCSSLSSLTFPNSLQTIGERAFGGCSELKRIDLLNRIKTVGAGAFDSCTSVSNVTIGNNVTSIGNNAFARCIELKTITIPGSLTLIDTNMLYGCTSLRKVIILEGVTSIGTNAFFSCESLSSIIMPNSVKSISDTAFLSTRSNYISNVLMYCYENSYAHTYALKNKIKTELIPGSPMQKTDDLVNNQQTSSAKPVKSSEKSVTAILSPDGAAIEGSSISANTSYNTTTLAVNLNVSAGADWKLYTDANCTTEITNKTMTLEEGINTAYVKVTSADNSSQIYTLTVNRAADSSVIPVTGIVIDGSLTISENGGTLQLSPAITPENATNTAVTWSIVDGDCATVSENGILTAIANGIVTVRATACDDSSIYGEITVTVTGQTEPVSYDDKTVSDNGNRSLAKPLCIIAAIAAIIACAGAVAFILIKRKKKVV